MQFQLFFSVQFRMLLKTSINQFSLFELKATFLFLDVFHWSMVFIFFVICSYFYDFCSFLLTFRVNIFIIPRMASMERLFFVYYDKVHGDDKKKWSN